MTGTWKFVANGNDKALIRAINGDVQGALNDLDLVRDAAVEMEAHDEFLKNQIECRRLEQRLMIAGFARDLSLFSECLQDIGRSERFSVERLHEMVTVAGGHLIDMAKESDSERP